MLTETEEETMRRVDMGRKKTSTSNYEILCNYCTLSVGFGNWQHPSMKPREHRATKAPQPTEEGPLPMKGRSPARMGSRFGLSAVFAISVSSRLTMTEPCHHRRTSPPRVIDTLRVEWRGWVDGWMMLERSPTQPRPLCYRALRTNTY